MQIDHAKTTRVARIPEWYRMAESPYVILDVILYFLSVVKFNEKFFTRYNWGLFISACEICISKAEIYISKAEIYISNAETYISKAEI